MNEAEMCFTTRLRFILLSSLSTRRYPFEQVISNRPAVLDRVRTYFLFPTSSVFFLTYFKSKSVDTSLVAFVFMNVRLSQLTNIFDYDVI